MRILVITVVHEPRDARIHGRQIESLLRAGHEVVYAAPWEVSDPPPDRPGLSVVPLPRARGRDRARAQRAAWRTIRAHDGRVDVVLGHDPELLGALAAVRQAAAVWDVHEDLPSTISDKTWIPGPLQRPTAALTGLGLAGLTRRVEVILAEEAYRDRWPDAPVVPNTPWVPVEVPPPDDGRVVYLGRISRNRGADDLVALARTPAARGRVHLIGPADGDVRPAVEAAEARGDLRWHGFVPNECALEMIQGATVGLSLLHDTTNYRHSVPTKILEYMARGVPVVATSLDRTASVVTEAGAGVLVAPGDRVATVDAVTAFLNDPGLRERHASRGREAVSTLWSWDDDGPRFVRLVESLAAGRTGR